MEESEYILPDDDNVRGPIHSWVDTQNQNQTSLPVQQLRLPCFETEEEDPDIEIKEEVYELFVGKDEEMITNVVNNSNPTSEFKSVPGKLNKHVIFQPTPMRTPRRLEPPISKSKMSTPRRLESISKSKKKIKTFPCIHCGLKFPTSRLKRVHEKDCDSPEIKSESDPEETNEQTDEIQPTQMTTRRNFELNSNSKLNKNKFPCCHCGFEFQTIRLKQIHEKGCGRAPNSQFPCDQCDKKYLTKQRLSIHTRKAHNADSTWKCRYCELTFSSCESRFNHEEDTHKTIPCTQDDCDSKFYLKCHLKEHIYSSHTDTDNAEAEIGKKEALVGRKPKKKRKKSIVYSKRYSCKVCGRNFMHRTTRDRHEWTHTEEKPFPCNKKGCDEKFISKSVLDTHLRRVHGEGEIVRPHSCEECPMKFQTKLQVIVHKRRHTGERPFKCEERKSLCSATFYSANALDSHIQRCHGYRNAFPCERSNCEKTFPSKVMLQRHLRHVHREGGIVRPHSCEECDKKFKTKLQLVTHRRRHTGEKPFKCEIEISECSDTFYSARALQSHVKTWHSHGDPLPCNKLDCNETFQTKSKLRAHLRKVHGEEITGQRSGQGQVVKRTGQKSHKCKYCETSCVSTYVLSQHVLRRHAKPEEMKYKCEYGNCNKVFAMQTFLNMHRKTHAKDKRLESHKCEYCETSCASASVLEVHVLRVHPKPEEMNYKCEHENCGKTFARETFLKMHSKKHSKEKRFRCQKCDGAFKDNAGLTNHIIFKHRYDEDVQKQYWTE